MKRTTTILLALLIIAAMLVGCGSTATPAPTSAPAAPTTSAPAATKAPPAATTSAPTAATTTAASTAAASTAAATTAAAAAKPANPDLILATTTSTQDSGLLDTLIPLFEKQTGYKVKTVAVGSGAAMTMGEKGEADVLLVHSPDAEKTFMEKAHGTDRKLVMHNDFIILGPSADSAKIKGTAKATDAMKKIADAKALFISRADNSGTNALELKLWKALTITPKGQSWYQETGQGMGATLNVAAEKNGYTISDRATYLANQKTVKLDILVENDPALLNVYHVITVDPKKSDKINSAGAKAFSDWIISKDIQDVISKFGVEKYGKPLFFADATKTDAELGLK